MDEGEFCVVCGATGRALVDGLCGECAADRRPLVAAPRHGTVTVCPHCGAREVRAHWERAGTSRTLDAEDLAPFLEVDPEAGVREVRWEERDASANLRKLVGRARVVFRGATREVDVPLTVKVVSRTCPECSRKSGRYYTAVVQLRGDAGRSVERPAALHRRLEARWTELLREARPDWRRAFSWREELPEGWDLYFTETLPARAIARLAKQRFGASLKESASLFGRKDGHDVYRVTLCVRFPRAPKSPAAGPGPGVSSPTLEQ